MKKKEESLLKARLKEVFQEMKELSVKILDEGKDLMDDVSKELNRKQSKKKSKVKSKKRRFSVLRILLLLFLNLLFFVWIWISLFAIIFSFLISSFAIFVSGAFLVAFSIFSIIKYSSSTLSDILFSTLFAGIGTMILGSLFMMLFEKLMKVFMVLTRKYIKLNSKLSKK